MAFPLASPPAGYAAVSWGSNRRTGIHYVGDTVTATLSTSGADAYEIRDYWGTIVGSGSVSGTSVSLGSSWDPGWYRLYLTGSGTDATFGDSYGAGAFIVIRPDTHFVTNPSTAVGPGQGGGEAKDLVMKGVLGVGTQRHQISDASAPTTGIDTLATAEFAAPLGETYWANPGAPYADAVRPERTQMLQFPNRAFDRIEYTGGNPGFRVYVKTEAVNGANVYLQVENGSASGKKYTVRTPNSSTIVETYDNIADAPAAITAMNGSAYVKAFGGSGPNPSNTGPTAIGAAYSAGVTSVVTALYPDGITHYEGPVNEGELNAELAHRMRLFQASVHAGNASAKAIGPCSVEINSHYLDDWEEFFDAGGGDYCDEISFHAYNSQTNGHINLGRVTIEAFLAKLAEHSQDAKPLWCTESTHVMTSVYGVYHPRRSRVPLLQTLLWEQYGLPRERNLVWYDRSHGFWAYPAWLMMGDTRSPVPYAALYRTLAEETWGKDFTSQVDFGSEAANAIFLGSLYGVTATGATTLVLVAQSYMPDCSVTLSITGTSSPLTVVDGFGNETSEAISGGLAVIPVSDIPTYVRLPEDVTAAVYSVNDWGPVSPVSLSSSATTKEIGGTLATEIGDDAFLSNYSFRTGLFISTNALPEDATLLWDDSITTDRVVVFCGPAWQNGSCLVDFDVETTINGTDWAVAETVTRTSPSSFHFGTDSTDAGCKQETYWDEQWIFDVPIPQQEVLGVRLNVRETSYGGEPDTAAIAAGGQGSTDQRLALEEIMVLEALLAVSSSYARPGIVGGGGGSTFVRYGG